MYGFKNPKFEFPIKRAQIDFWFIGFRRCVRGPTEINPPTTWQYCCGLDNRVWTYVWGFLKPSSILVWCYFKIQCALHVMYGFRGSRFEFPIKRAHIDFWPIGFRKCVRGPTEVNPQPPCNVVVAWKVKFCTFVSGFLKPHSFLKPYITCTVVCVCTYSIAKGYSSKFRRAKR